MGSIVAGVRGDITLVPLYGSGGSLSAVPSKTALLAKADASFNDTATLTISGGSGTYTVIPNSSSASVIECTGSGSSWTVSIKNDTTPGTTGKVMFADNITATIDVTDTVSGDVISVSLTLKNEYSLEIGYSDLALGIANTWQSSTTFNAGDTFNFSSVPVTSLGIPSGRQIVAYKDAATNTTYKITTTPPDTLTFSSALGRREVYLGAVLDLILDTKDAVNSTWSGTSYTNPNGETGLLYTLEKYSSTTKELRVAVSGCSDNSNLSVIPENQNKLEIADSSLTTSGSFVVKLTANVTNAGIPSTGYIYKITVKDNGTGAEKIFFVKVAQPPEYKYTLKYTKADGSLATIGTANQDQTFVPGSGQLRFGVAAGVPTLTMGDLDSSLTGVEAAIQITGWTSTRASFPPTYSTPFPNPGSADCESDYTITLIATTSPNIGTFYSNCRASESNVQNGDVMLSSGLCVDKTYYTNNSTFLDPYVVGSVCIRAGNQKFVVAKSSDLVNDKYWSRNSTSDIGGLQVTVTGTNTGDAGTPLYDVASAPTITNISGKDSYAAIQNSGIGNINSYEPFVYCRDYSPTNITTSSYYNSWYLPSLIEAVAINQYRDTFNTNLFGVSNPWFMTSSQYTQTQYWYIQGGATAGTGTITAKNKTVSDTNIEVYPCHEFNFTAPPQ